VAWAGGSVALASKTVELASQSVELATKSVELASQSVELVTRSVELVTRSVELVGRTVELVIKSVELVIKSVELATKSVEVATKSVELASKTASAGGKSAAESITCTRCRFGAAPRVVVQDAEFENPTRLTICCSVCGKTSFTRLPKGRSDSGGVKPVPIGRRIAPSHAVVRSFELRLPKRMARMETGILGSVA